MNRGGSLLTVQPKTPCCFSRFTKQQSQAKTCQNTNTYWFSLVRCQRDFAVFYYTIPRIKRTPRVR